MDKPQVDRDRGHSARHRHRPDEPGAHLALDRRHDDGAERSPEAAVRARRRAALPRLRPAGAARHAGQRSSRDLESSALGPGDPRLLVTLPGHGARELRRRAKCCKLLEQQGYTRIHARDGRMLEVVQDRFRASAAPGAAACSRRSRRRCGSAADGSRCARDGWQGDIPLFDDREKETVPCPALLGRPALRRLRHPLPRADAEPLLVQLAARRLRDLPRFRPRDRHRLRPRGAGPSRTLRGGAVRPWQTESYKECQDDLVRFARKRGMPLDTPWRELTEEQRRWVIDGEGRGRRRSGTARDGSSRGSRPRATGCTSACCCRSTAATRPARLRRRAAQARGAAVAARRDRRRAPGPQHPRPDAAADRRVRGFLRGLVAAGAARRGDRPAARRDPLAARIPGARGPRLPDARPPVAHAVGRRGAAHQPDHGARHLAGEHAVRAGRAVHRAASARHAPRRSR